MQTIKYATKKITCNDKALIVISSSGKHTLHFNLKYAYCFQPIFHKVKIHLSEAPDNDPNSVFDKKSIWLSLVCQ